MEPLWTLRLGVVPYAPALRAQKLIEGARQAGELPDVLLLLEHPPTYTKGRRASADELPMGEEWYRLQGIEVCETDRGGRVTYHGPGQLVGYPVMSLRPLRDDVHDYVRRMEGAVVAALGDFGVAAGPIDGLTGVWTGELSAAAAAAGRARKIASIGIHVNRGITTHGFAVNVGNDLQPFEWIVPCGIESCRMTSLTRELGEAQSLDAFARAAARCCRPRPCLYVRSMEAAAPTEPRLHVTRSRAHPGGARGLEGRPFRERKPPWLKVPAPGGPTYRRLKQAIHAEGLHTVCEEANCPNVGECCERGTATFMILGDVCTRRCGFCNVQ